MKNSSNIARQLIRFALVTIFLANSFGPSLFASSRPGSHNVRNEWRTTSFATLPTPVPVPADEQQLAYFRSDPNTNQSDIFRRRANGADLLNLTNNPATYSDFVWSPDGSRIAFGRYDQSITSINLFVMDTDGANQTRLTNSPTEQDFGMVWSPDGARLAFSAYDLTTNTASIHTINADGSNVLTLTASAGNDNGPAWSPDGTRISFRRSFFDLQTGSFAASIYVMSTDGSNQIKFDNLAGEIDYNPAWSPDSAQIAWARFPNDGQHGPNLFVALRDGTNMRNLTNDFSISFDGPQWSPDGSKLSFLSTPDNINYALSVINADGSGRTTLSGSVANISSNKGWSPNGAKLAFTVSYGEVFNGLYLVNADGTGLTHIGDDSERNDNPVWSPDSAKLAFTSAPNSLGSINIVNADGMNRVDLTNDPAGYAAPKWQPAALFNTPAGTNVTVTVGGVQFTFANVTQAGQTTVTPIDPASAGTLPGGYTLVNGSLAFQITTTAIYSGSITVCIVESSVNDQTTFDSLRILHGEGGTLVDRTILPPDAPAPNFSTRTICARVTSLSPFVVAKLAYGVQTLFDQTKPVKSGSTLPVKLRLTNASGVNVSSASLVVTALSVLRVSTNTSGDVQDSGNSNPDNNFRYAGGFYIFNLSTKGYATGTYLLRFKAGSDLINYTVQFQVR
jgi:Tol biopolymer transport system component